MFTLIKLLILALLVSCSGSAKFLPSFTAKRSGDANVEQIEKSDPPLAQQGQERPQDLPVGQEPVTPPVMVSGAFLCWADENPAEARIAYRCSLQESIQGTVVDWVLTTLDGHAIETLIVGEDGRTISFVSDRPLAELVFQAILEDGQVIGSSQQASSETEPETPAMPNTGETPLTIEETPTDKPMISDPVIMDVPVVKYALENDVLDHATVWMETAANNSMMPGDFLQLVGNGVSRHFATIPSADTFLNVHSHIVMPGSETWQNYEVQGRLKRMDASTGAGITFYSAYPSEDNYYRMMFNADGINVTPHPWQATPRITCEVPEMVQFLETVAGAWYRFRIQIATVEGVPSFRSKIWKDDLVEPDWQRRCKDTSDQRRVAGTVGFWHQHQGMPATESSAYWDDIQVIEISPDIFGP